MKKIAIIGMSFRFPGTTNDQYWKDLVEGRDLVTQIDPSRWAQETFLHPDKSHPGTSYTFAAGCLGDVSGFDAEFFGISPREAAQVDPQQRLLLEMTWEALENAGLRPRDLRGADCGVFVGISSADYAYRLAEDLGAVDSAIATGNTSSIAANRISYFFDFHGPSLAIDTACSSSMVAFHEACRSVAGGESSLAVAGGISLLLHPFGFIAFSKASMLSRQGRCRVFDAAGDGYVRSEGGAVFVLKDHDRALAEGDPILAVVAGTSANTDGRKSGLTVPGRAAQASLLRRAYEEAGIEPGEIDYIEAHGTGTAVGDPIEAGALGEAIGMRRPAGKPLLIGSVKSNLGHLEAASGAAGLVKAIHCLRMRMVPPSIHFEVPNPRIPFEEWNLRVPVETTPLAPSGRLVVGVNSFGFGGANAHVILESPRDNIARLRPQSPVPARQVALPVVISGRSEAALKAAARSMAVFLRTHHDASLHDLAWTATCRREWHAHRAVVLGATVRSVAAHFDEFADGADASGAVVAATALAPPVGVAFVYSGNGSQWEGMGMRLLAEDATFRSAVHAVEQVFERHSDFSVLEVLSGMNSPGSLAHTEIAQPALFAIQVGLTEMLRVRGVSPSIVLGHSVGEVAAAWAAGALTLEQAVRVVHHRSTRQAPTRGNGQMTAVGLGAGDVLPLIESLGLAGVLETAGENSPRGVVVAGAVPGLEALEAALAERGASFRRLDLDYAFHSAAMDPIEADLKRDLAFLKPRRSRLAFVSTVTGEELEGTALDAGYWWRNVREPVRFAKAAESARKAGASLFVEIGPHSLLRGYLGETLRSGERACRVIATMMRGDGAPAAVSKAALEALLAGAPVDLKAYFPAEGQLAALPAYPWQRDRHWIEPTADAIGILGRYKVHPLLGYRPDSGVLAWENRLDARTIPALADHALGGSVVMPGAAFAELALAAANQWRGGGAQAPWLDVEELDIRSPLLFVPGHSRTLRFSLDATDGSFAISARESGSLDPWTVHATGRVLASPLGAPPFDEAFEPPAGEPDFDAASHYRLTRRAALEYGPAFRAVERGWIGADTVCARLRLPPEAGAQFEPALLHPALLDGAFQLLVHLARGGHAVEPGVAFVPVRIARLLVRKDASAPVFARTRVERRSPRSLTVDVSLFDEAGTRVAWLRGVRLRRVTLQKAAADRFHYLDEAAVPMPHPEAPRRAASDGAATMAAALRSATGGVAAAGALRRYADQVDPLLDAFAASLAEDLLRRLAGEGGVLSDAALSEVLARDPEASSRVSALVSLLAEDGILVRGAPGWTFAGETGSPAHEAIWNEMVADFPEYGELVRRVGRAGLRLEAALAGGGQGSPSASAPAAGLFAEALGADGLHSLREGAGNWMASAIAGLAEGECFGVVEISRFAPVFARSLLRRAGGDRVDYDFATPGPESAEWCRQCEDEFPALRAHSFVAGNGEAEMADFPEGTARLALVVDDFAGEADASGAVRLARRALCRDGVLVFLGLPPARWMNLAADADGEGVARLRSAESRAMAGWRRRLAETGFEADQAVELLPAGGTGVVPFAIVARAGDREDAAPRKEAGDPGAWVVVRDPRSPDEELLDGLRARMGGSGVPCAVLEAGAGEAQDTEALAGELAGLRAREGAIAGIVILATHGPALAGEEDDGLERAARQCAAMAGLVKACEKAQVRANGWWVVEGASSAALPGRKPAYRDVSGAALRGFARSLANEPASLAVRLVDVERDADSGRLRPEAVDALWREMRSPDAEREVTLTAAGGRFVPRLREAGRHRAPPGGHDEAHTLRLGFAVPGQLRNLRWEVVPRAAPKAGEIEIEVAATGLNFRDVMYSLGLLSEEAVESGFAGATLGLECSGIVTRTGPGVAAFAAGDRVVGFGASCFARHAILKAGGAARIPGVLGLQAAATIPIAFFTAWYALGHLARLRPGERVLIHGAAGGVGLAAIQVARHLGAEIFATAGSGEKRDYLRLLGVERVFDSRSLEFADDILAATAGEGVDVVLNSLAGEAVNRNLRLLRPFGRFLELGKRDFYENTRIGLRPFRNNVAYFGIDADQLMQEHPQLASALFAEVMSLFANGVLHPLPFHEFDADDVIEACRFMQQSRQTGKIVVTFRGGIHRVHAPPAPATWRPRADATYLVAGGLGGFGLRTAQWLAEKGATHLLLAGRSGPASAESAAAVAALEEAGVRVMARACDVSDADALAALLAQAQASMPPLAGVFHAAAVYEDALVTNLDEGQLRRVLAPKLRGAANLDRLSRGLRLDCFVLFSSATTLFGNPGQAAYVAANAALDALAAARRSRGLPALCVRWGAIEDVGFLARHEEIRRGLHARMGGRLIRSEDALAVLEELLAADRSGLGVMDLDWPSLRRFLPAASHPRFLELARHGAGADAHDADAVDVRRMLAELDPAELLEAIKGMLKAELGQILRVPVEKMDDAASVYDMGMDSLMGVELALALEQRFGIQVPVMILGENPTIARLAERIVSLLRGAAPGQAGAPAEDLAGKVSHIAGQHAIEVDRSVIERFAKDMEAGEAKPARRVIP